MPTSELKAPYGVFSTEDKYLAIQCFEDEEGLTALVNPIKGRHRGRRWLTAKTRAELSERLGKVMLNDPHMRFIVVMLDSVAFVDILPLPITLVPVV